MEGSISIEQYDAIVDLIYASALDTGLWQATLRTIQDAVSGCGALLGVNMPMRPALLEVTGYDAEAMESFANVYASKSYVWSLLPFAQEGSLIHDRNVLPADQRRRDVFANEWAPRYDTTDCMILPLLKRESATAFAVFGRSPGCGPFERDAQDLFGRLLPHLQRAVRIRIELDSAEFRAALGVDAIEKLRECVILVKQDATIAFANAAARELLAWPANGLEMRASRLAARNGDTDMALQRLIGAAAGSTGSPRTGGILVVDGQDRLRPLTLFCVPLRETQSWLIEPEAVAMLFISDLSRRSPPSHSLLGALYGLTAAETRLASHLAVGATLAQAARELGVARTTVASQLQAIFAKTRTHRQPELVGLLNSLPVISLEQASLLRHVDDLEPNIG
jgi:DNA-binding CsgD family transcriptional regulator